LKAHQKSDMEKFFKANWYETVCWRQLSHPNVVPFYGIFGLLDTPRVCLVSPWLENASVVHYLAEQAPNSNCVILSLDIAQGLEYLHHQGIIHGNIQGLNIRIAASGRACLADSGFNTEVADPSGPTINLLRWMGPELFPDMMGPDPDDMERTNTRATDVYAFGMVCYEMFSDHRPFSDISVDFQVLFAVKQGRRPSRPTHKLSCIRGLNDEMWHIIEACWNQDPSERPSTTEVIKYLRELPNQPVDQRPLNDFDATFPSWLLSAYSGANYPFSILAMSPEDTDKMRELKDVFRDMGT